MSAENDIVTRLRQFGDSYGLDAEAADEIERLRKALNYSVSELLPVHDHWGEFDHHEVVAQFLEEASHD